MSSAKITYSIKGGPRRSKPWFDKDCYDMKKLAKESLKKYRKTNRLEDRECCASSRKKYLALLDLKRKGFDNEKQEILRNAKDSKTFWKTIALYKSTSIIQGEIAIQDWLNFYRELMTTEKNLRICNLHNVISQNDPILDTEITNADIYKEIVGLKSNKACGPDGIPNEVLKILPDSYILLLKQLYNSVMTTGKYPAIWTNSTIHPIFKNGYKNSPSNYRDLPSVNLPEFGDIHLLLYADDIAIIGESRMNLQKKIKILKEYLDENLMTLNESKSKIMVFRNGGYSTHLTFRVKKLDVNVLDKEQLNQYKKELGSAKAYIKDLLAQVNGLEKHINQLNLENGDLCQNAGLYRSLVLDVSTINWVTSKTENLLRQVTSETGNLLRQVTSETGNLLRQVTSETGNLLRQVTSKTGNLLRQVNFEGGNLLRQGNFPKQVTSKTGNLLRQVTSKAGNLLRQVTFEAGNLLRQEISQDSAIIELRVRIALIKKQLDQFQKNLGSAEAYIKDLLAQVNGLEKHINQLNLENGDLRQNASLYRSLVLNVSTINRVYANEIETLKIKASTYQIRNLIKKVTSIFWLLAPKVQAWVKMILESGKTYYLWIEARDKMVKSILKW
ncbi:hypothetical protein LAZ67_3000265 [Cordylochernes scorpioides]|uniref:Reverse transcriptase domain-containing protein n=1 Tax=Cordylochernes scorpioides TaxID=51811 RepID=A0ABY6K7N1_9ARAC|nr:hypothetical protein LAZ67_3000265 [Cordylochernes scorpioides]